jgi:putative membrane protein
MKHLAGIFGAGVAIAMVASPALARSAADYVAKAGAGDMYEIRSSRIVLGSTRNPAIRNFANRMITDHSQSTAMVKAAAHRSGMTPRPPMLDRDQRAMLAQLRAAHGRDRDGLYVSQQKTAHDQALALHQGYAADGDKPALQAAAAKIVPVVQHHIAMLNHLSM